MSTLPVIAIVGATGLVSQVIAEQVVSGLKEGRLGGVRLLGSCPTSNSKVSYLTLTPGVSFHPINFKFPSTLQQALCGVDVVVNGMGHVREDSYANCKLLLETVLDSQVKVYFTPDFVTNYHSQRYHSELHSFWTENLKEHYELASTKKELKTISMSCSMLINYAFTEWNGLSRKESGGDWVWETPGHGNTPIAYTSFKDLGRFVLEGAIAAFENPALVPSVLDVCSDARTLREYAAGIEAQTGKKIQFKEIPLQEAMEKFKGNGDIVLGIRILYELGSDNYNKETANGNKLLNPEERKWKLDGWEEWVGNSKGEPMVPQEIFKVLDKYIKE